MAHEKTTFFTIDRKLLSDDLWLSEPFTKGQAWVDLIGRANFADRQKISGPRVQTIKRGQVVTSMDALARRWQWSRHKVRDFISALEAAGMVSTFGTSKGTILTIENYAFYQNVGPAKSTAKGQQKANGGPTGGTLNNNDNKGNKGNNIIPPKSPRGGRGEKRSVRSMLLEDEEAAANDDE